MDRFGHININQIKKNIYLLDEDGMSTGYLIVGTQRAISKMTM